MELTDVQTYTDTAMMKANMKVSVDQDLKRARDLKKIEEAATDFEAVFMSEMIKPMFENISTEAPFGGGKGEEVFRGFLIQEYGKQLASGHSIGLADTVKAEMIKLQEAQSNASSTTNF